MLRSGRRGGLREIREGSDEVEPTQLCRVERMRMGLDEVGLFTRKVSRAS